MKSQVIQNEPNGPAPTTVTSDPQRSRASNLVRRHPVVTFFVLCYAATWSLWTPLVVLRDDMPGPIGFVLLVLGSMVPSVVAILLVAHLHGGSAVKKLLGRLLKARVGLRWYLAILLLTALVPLGLGLSIAQGGSGPAAGATIVSALVIFTLSIFPGSAMGEEWGWRGFALPHLQRNRSALTSSLVIGAIWGCWHLPLYLTGSDFRWPSIFPAFFLSVVAASVICTWMYNSTRGSLLIVVLYHAAANLPISLFLAPLGRDLTQPYLIYVAFLVVAAAAIVVTTGPANLSRTQPKQIDVP